MGQKEQGKKLKNSTFYSLLNIDNSHSCERECYGISVILTSRSL